MTPDQLKVVRNFFALNDEGIDTVVTETFSVFFAASPDGAALFKGDLTAFRETFIRMLRTIIALTRDSHLWPVSAESGHVAIPGFGDLRAKHISTGVTYAHCEAMKSAMVETLEKICPDSFTSEVREAFALFFDTLAHSLTDASSCGRTSDTELQNLLERPPTDLPALLWPAAERRTGPLEHEAETRNGRFTDEQIAAILREAERLLIFLVAKKHGVSELTVQGWRKRLGALPGTELRQLRQLETENARLRRLLVARDLEIEEMREAAAEKW